ncbi:DNA repair protein RecN [Zobellia galactanivorans]|uniref:DNA repair protein RecN n=1 Tax=Zobellia TaxID=112040 RepID=UPI000B537D4C|nr:MULTISPECIES: DNA repair protein RecN [Zobellia]MBU3027081.1 DNA repair protein RecN [Zobellia galactanivorans]MDO6807989.1 DNA repair protein RecN [Zobellia galactanivorans]OWW24887.1 DNA repair protein RecN [Zobellia sp. OII3]
MLVHLSIKNYALIDDLNVAFTKGFTCITGETGAGKSILLGGLSLVLGKRADLSSLRNKEKKCIIEAEFQIDKYNLKSFFQENDLDYEERTIIRREIQPSGKSRAFINDSPVTLDVLTRLGSNLIDVHSQHQTLQLTENDFQLKVIDALAGNKDLLADYGGKLRLFKATSKELSELIEFQKEANKEHDYNSFLLQELQAAPLKLGLQEELEEQYEQLNNVENILELIASGHQLLNDEQVGIVSLLTELKQLMNRLSGYGSQYADLNQRVQSVFIEVDDIASELQTYQEDTEANPQLLEETNAKLQQLYDLQKKHGVQEVSELLEIREGLSEKVSVTENLEADIEKKEKELAAHKTALQKAADVLTAKRKKVIPELKKQLEDSLKALGMASATFKIELFKSNDFKANGADGLTFLFSANKGGDYGELKKVASGGELSRIMLTIKSILAKYENLPTIMFDEIDTGVSGEISGKMGDIMQEMSRSMQVFSITHLPQVASKGDHHFKVYKQEEGAVTKTNMKELEQEERVVELAEMLGGKELSDSAMAHARQLLN